MAGLWLLSGVSVLGGASFDGCAGVDGQGDAGDVAGLVGGEEQHGVGDVHRLDPGDGKRVEGLEYRLDFLPGQQGEITREQATPAFQSLSALPIPWMESVDISNAVLFLASDEARYITGVTLPVDAGSLVK